MYSQCHGNFYGTPQFYASSITWMYVLYNLKASQRRQPRILTSKFCSFCLGRDDDILDFEVNPNQCEEIYQHRCFVYDPLQNKWQIIAVHVRRISIFTHVCFVKKSSFIPCNQELKVELRKKKYVFSLSL